MGLIKRIVNHWTAALDADDRLFTDHYLDDAGKFLFFQMSMVDQKHALAVARMIINDASNISGLQINLLVKAALLHDVGKVEGDLSLTSRILVGIVRRIIPTLRGRLAQTNPNSFWEKIRYGFYVDLVHPARGAHMAKLFGVEESIVQMIRHHHDPPFEGQSPELTWLQLADGKN